MPIFAILFLISSYTGGWDIAMNTSDYEGNWFQEVIKGIKESEYEIRWQERFSEYQSPNRFQNLRFSYYRDGFRACPRESQCQWVVDVRLEGYGWFGNFTEYQGDMLRVDGRKAVVTGNGVDIEFENREDGMREDFRVFEKEGRGYLVLEFRVKSVGISMIVDDNEISFVRNVHGGASVLRYGDMKVTDKNGKILRGIFNQIDSCRFAIIVDDRDAEYPILIDPVSTTPNWQAQSDQEYAIFGYSVSSAGDVNGDGFSDVIVGAPFYDDGQVNEGAAFVYHGSSAGLSTTPNWFEQSDIIGAFFGYSVSSAGDVNGDGFSDVVVGSPDYDSGQHDEGAAFVYHGSSAGLSTTADWMDQSDQEDALFGWSVSSAGDVNGDGFSDVIVGAPLYDDGQTDEGAAFVYHGSSAGLSATADWMDQSDQVDALFGWSVSSGGDVNGDGFSEVAVGSPYYDSGQTDEGVVFVYHGSSAGLSTTAVWTGQSNQDYASYGYSVSSAGDVNGDGFSEVAVGSPSYDSGQTDEGVVFVYHGTSAGLSTTADWIGRSNQSGSWYGQEVSSAGDVNGDGFSDVIVGSPYYHDGQVNEGAAFVYQGSSSGLSTTAVWMGQSDQEDALLGYSVSSGGDVNGDGFSDVIVGSPYYDVGQIDEGTAFVYHGSSSGLSTTADWMGQSDQEQAGYGISVSSAGDVNGDGFSDVIVGALFYDDGQTNEGAAFVYHGSSAGLSTTADWMGQSDQADAQFGYSVSSGGDVNGDGFSDVIVGAPGYDDGQTNEGAAFVYHGSSSGLSTTAVWLGQSNQEDALFGYSVSSAGDVNGDGYSDVIVGSPYYDDGQVNEGAAFVYHGSSSGLSTTAVWTGQSNQSGSWYGRAVSSAGDVNGDGFSDVVVGADFYQSPLILEGAAFGYHGSSSGLSTTADWLVQSNQEGASLGKSVSSAGDVNGDGYSDVIVGAPYYDDGQINEGAAFVYQGSSSGLSTTAVWMGQSDQEDALFGWSVSSAGDVNGDGFSDVVVGADFYESPLELEGTAFVYHGSSSGLSTTADWLGQSGQLSASYSSSVSSAGDVNGDGYSDVIVGAPYYDDGQTDEGAAFVYFGNEGLSREILIKQKRSDLSTPIIPPLSSYSNNSFGMEIKLFSIYGRMIAKYQIEIKPYNTPFTGTDLIEGAWTDLGTTGHTFNQTISGLTVSTLYKWRVRIKYHPKYGASQLYSRWYYIQSNALNEADFRTGFPLAVEEETTRSLMNFVRLSYIWTHSGKIKFIFNLPENVEGKLVIYNLLGAVVYEQTVQGRELLFDQRYPSGTYFARIYTLEGQSSTIKFNMIK